MGNGKQEVIKAAIRLEEDGRNFYLDAASKSESELARKMFESLAGDELKHMEWLESLSPAKRDAKEVNRDFYGKLRGIFAGIPESARRSAQISPGDMGALHMAIEIEKKSWQAYEKWAGETGDAEVRELCLLLAETERFHQELLENTRDYLNHTADWFFKGEDWTVDGG